MRCILLWIQSKGYYHFTTYDKKTNKISSNLNPEWNQDLTIPITKVNEEECLASSLICKVKDWKSTLGGINIPLKNIIEKAGTWLNDYWELVDEKGKNGVGYHFK